MIWGRAGQAAGVKALRLRRWFKRQVLKQAWMADSFADPLVQERMLVDAKRCETFREAIRRTVKPGDVVVDLGAGTGLLSFFAVQAGAQRVYAIEMSGIADLATQLISENGKQERITLIRGNSKKVRLPERCDVLISETLSSFCFDTENTIEFMADARERFLKPGGRIVPEACDTVLMPFSSDECGLGRIPAKFYDVAFDAFRRKRYALPELIRASGKNLLEIAPPQKCHHVNFYDDKKAPGPAMVVFKNCAEGRLDGFLGWFECQLCPGVTISNSPRLPLTAWWQLFFPMLEQPQIRKGQTIFLNLDANMVAGEAEWDYRVHVAAPSEQENKTM
jgi:type I protein arginine methyltransferase